MGWKARHRRIYEERIREDALARLLAAIDRKGIPLSDDELRTLAKKARERFRSTKRGALEKYESHLSKIYGAGTVAAIAAKLEEINNQIGYEEK